MKKIRIGNRLNDQQNMERKELLKISMVKAANYMSDSEPKLYVSESKIVLAILKRIEYSHSTLAEAYKVIFENSIDLDTRFFLESYLRGCVPQSRVYLDKWADFSQVPDKLIETAKNSIWLNNPHTE